MNDTSPEFERLHRRLLMERTPAERLAMASDMLDTAKALILADLAERGETRLREGLFLRLYGDDYEPEERDRIAAAIRAQGRPYTREELRAIADSGADGESERGDWCPRCRARIPQFAELDRDRERQLKAERLRAVPALMREVGCSYTWAKRWVVHSFGHPFPDTVPCPHCGNPLRTPRARQCLTCGMDWHDPENVVRRG